MSTPSIGPYDAPLGRLITLAGRLVGAHFQHLVDEAGVSVAGWFVLNRLATKDGLTLKDIADLAFVRPATMTGVVDTLERENLVRRERGSVDRRQVRLYITDEGRARLARVQDQVADGMAPVFDGVTQREEAVVRKVLARTIDRLGGVQSPDAAPTAGAWSGGRKEAAG